MNNDNHNMVMNAMKQLWVIQDAIKSDPQLANQINNHYIYGSNLKQVMQELQDIIK